MPVVFVYRDVRRALDYLSRGYWHFNAQEAYIDLLGRNGFVRPQLGLVLTSSGLKVVYTGSDRKVEQRLIEFNRARW